MRPMTVGRPRKFDTELVLERAMDVFWDKGYEATSVADVLAATGLHKGSLYQTFGDKKKLFIACLEHYQEQMFQMNKQIIESEPNPAEGLKKAMREMLTFTCSEGECGNSKGCMAVNTLVETAPFDADIRAVLEKNEEKFKSYMIGLLYKIQDSGVELKFPPEVLFAMMMTFMCGLSSVMKNMIGHEEGHQLLETQMQLLSL